MTRAPQRWSRLLVLGALLPLACTVSAQSPGEAPRARLGPWDSEVLAAFERVPVQDQGRIKPLSTYAGFLLLRCNARRSLTTPNDERIGPMEWLLDCLFYPEQARDYRHFEVRDSAILDAIGLSDVIHTKPQGGSGETLLKKRDRYSYNELLPGAQKLDELANQYLKIDSRMRNHVQEQILVLRMNVLEFSALTRFLDFARHDFQLPPSGRLSTFFEGRSAVAFSDLLSKMPALMTVLDTLVRGELPAGVDQEVAAQERRALEQLLGEFQGYGGLGQVLAVFPAQQTAEPESAWLTASDLSHAALHEGVVVPGHPELCASLEQMTRHLQDPPRLLAAARGLQEGTEKLATGRGEYRAIALEVRYYKFSPFYSALYVFGASFLVVALTWIFPLVRWLRKLSWGLVLVATALVIIGIGMRMWILMRPPVLGIYDTIPFITVGVILIAVVIERITRSGIALPLGSIVGFGGMFMAGRIEAMEGRDTMGRLQAVLDTNFWLSTHVTIVTLGYAAALLAAFIACIYVFGRLFHALSGAGVEAHRGFYKSLTRIVYGVICFGLLLSVVGTILGGIWANYSWGRFWGWDPKENGALLICLWEIAILHARMAGFIRDIGINIAAIGGAGVVVFSWWGVNILGKGLHSYGFTEGGQALNYFYMALVAVLLAGALLALLVRAAAAQKDASPPPAEA